VDKEEKMSEVNKKHIQGYVGKGFEQVHEAFVDNFSRQKELGAACCIYYHGEKVVDLWGGIRSKTTGEMWEEGTMVCVFSTAKGMAALTLALAHSRGLLDYEERVCNYWPEFAKDKITVRQLLAHQAGLFAIDSPVDKSLAMDLDRLVIILSRQKLGWEPGTWQAYHVQKMILTGDLTRK
jgi:CubicO group peptidase (beta-lactamase class C family)